MSTEAQIQQLIILEVGDEITVAWPAGVLAANIEVMWASFAAAGRVSLRLQEMYVKRRAIDTVLGIVRKQVTFNIANDHSRNQSDKAKMLMQMRGEVQAEIVRLEGQTRMGRAGAAGLITTVAPISPPYPNGIDANDPQFQGSPYTGPLNERKL